MCEPSIEKTELEEEFWSSHLVLPGLDSLSQHGEIYSDYKENVDKTIKKTVMKLFALACQSGLEMRAVELCELMPLQVVQLAIKYASKLGRAQLAERISEIASRKSEENVHPPLSTFSSSVSYNNTNAGIGNTTAKGKQDVADVSGQQMSQDMFAEDTDASNSENLIVSLKQKTSELKANEGSGNTLKRTNPFRKLADNKEENKKGLNGLMKVQAPLKKSISNSLTKGLASVKQTKQIVSNTTGKEKKTPFTEWYEAEKENLQKEFPELSTAELTKVAIKRFKESKQKPEKTTSEKPVSDKPASFQGLKKFLFTPSPNQNKENTSRDDSNSQEEGECKKRKLSPDNDSTPQEKKTK